MKFSRSVLFPVLCALLALAATGTKTFAQDPENLQPRLEFPLVGEIRTDRVNLRTGPSTDYRILRKLEPGERVVVVEENGDWFGVRVPTGFTGFVLATLVDVQGNRAVVKEDVVNLRPTASTQYFPAGQLRKGEELIVAGTEGEWVRVVAPERIRAYVAKEFVHILGPEKEYALDLNDVSTNARKQYALSGEGNAAVESALRIEIQGDYDRAESLYAAARAKEEGDYTEAEALYRKVAEQTLLPELARAAKLRLDAIQEFHTLHASLAEAREIQEKLASELEQARKDYEEELSEIQTSRTEPIQAVRNYEIGWVVRNTPINPFDLTEPQFKLIKGGRALCHLQSRKYDLRDFLDHQVIVSGDRVTDPETKLRVLHVRELEILAKR
jgi:SH3-like domain-containing protein